MDPFFGVHLCACAHFDRHLPYRIAVLGHFSLYGQDLGVLSLQGATYEEFLHNCMVPKTWLKAMNRYLKQGSIPPCLYSVWRSCLNGYHAGFLPITNAFAFHFHSACLSQLEGFLPSKAHHPLTPLNHHQSRQQLQSPHLRQELGLCPQPPPQQRLPIPQTPPSQP